MNKWQEVNYKFFLRSKGLLDNGSLRKAFMSGFALCDHINTYGYPDAYEPPNMAVELDRANQCACGVECSEAEITCGQPPCPKRPGHSL